MSLAASFLEQAVYFVFPLILFVEAQIFTLWFALSRWHFFLQAVLF